MNHQSEPESTNTVVTDCPHKVSFGEFVFDFRKQTLGGQSGEIALNSKALAVLEYLLRRPNEIVCKEDLFRAVWAEVAVTDDALVQRILDIRKALGDDPRNPRFIRTHSRKGYEFVAEIRPIEKVLSNVVSSPVEIPQHRGRPRRLIWVLLAAAVVCLILLIDRFWRVLSPQRQTPELYISRLTFLPGMEDYPTFDPSRERILYASDEDGVSNLWILNLKSNERIQLGHETWNSSEPDWSPDGEWIVFRSERQSGGLFLRSVSSGNLVEVAPYGHHPRWSQDGSQIVFHTEGRRGEIFVWNLKDKSVRTVDVIRPILFNQSFPVWSQNGRHIYFVASAQAAGRSFPTEKSNDWVALGHQIWKVPATGGEAQVVTPGFGIVRDAGFDLDAINCSLIFTGLDHSLWLLKLTGPSKEPARNPTRLTFTTEGHQHPRFSPLGDIVFSTISSPEALWLLPFAQDGKLQLDRMEKLTHHVASARGPAVSPDGQRLAYFTWQGERFEIWCLDLKAKKSWRVSPADRVSRTLPAWSRDGAALVYTVLDGSIREHRVAWFDASRTTLKNEVKVNTELGSDTSQLINGSFVVNDKGDMISSSSGENQAAPGGGSSPSNWDLVSSSPSGRYIIYSTPERHFRKLWLARSDRSNPVLLTQQPGKYLNPAWSAGERHVFLQADTDGWFNLWGFQFDPEQGRTLSHPTQLTFFRGNPFLLSDMNLGFTVISQGLVVSLRENRSDLWLIKQTLQSNVNSR